MQQRVGILGGTFDPVHYGHLRAAEEAVELLELDRLLFIPAAAPPHKPDRLVASFEHRWRMLELALRDNTGFALSDIERRLPGKSYTVVTLRTLQEEMSAGIHLYFLVGLDAFLEVDTWWQFGDLFRLASMVVLRRPGYRMEALEAYLQRRISDGYVLDVKAGSFVHPTLLPVHYLRNSHLEISSTGIRYLVARSRSIRYLVPPEIVSYIQEENLYKN